MNNYITVPMEIESKSFEIIKEELGEKTGEFTQEELKVVQRVIHTSADFEYASLIKFSEDVIAIAKETILKGTDIYCDTKMIVSGLNKDRLASYNSKAYTLVSDEDVAKIAKEKGITRSMAGIEKAAKNSCGIYIIGNAPTALFRLKELIDNGEIEKPKVIIGVPVGFVGAAESKEILKDMGVPYITVEGRKGGSTIAVAILHGILYQLRG